MIVILGCQEEEYHQKNHKTSVVIGHPVKGINNGKNGARTRDLWRDRPVLSPTKLFSQRNFSKNAVSF
jgi:hypothetical protein